MAVDLPIAIIGAGFSGVALGVALKEAGIDSFTIYEAAPALGGTWRDNTYPGCACDVPSHLYSFSFEPKADWSRDHGAQGEILDYLRRCADKYGVSPHVRLGAKVIGLDWDEGARTWHLSLEGGERVSACVVVTATGPLSRPSIPALRGLDRFEGPFFHSARWNHDVDLEGKTVASIGTGASAVQYVPEIAKRAKKLYVVQRTPAWILPKNDGAFSAKAQARFRRHPALARAFRSALYWKMELRVLAFVYEPRILRMQQRATTRELETLVPDPALRDALLPRYEFGCKRVLFSDDFYQTLVRPNVELVPSAVTSIGPRSIRTADDRELDVDAIVFGTGFEIGRGLIPGHVRGRNGRDLNEAWASGLEAYYGVAVSGFPNLFMMLGPNSGVGHTSMIFMIEAQARYIRECLAWMRRDGLATLEVLPEPERRHNEDLTRRFAGTVWSSGCQSWYRDARGRNIAIWPGFTFEYWLRTRRPNRRHFRAQ